MNTNIPLNNQITQQDNNIIVRWIRRFKHFLVGKYYASLIGTSFITPIIASALTIGCYASAVPQISQYALLYGFLGTCAIWFFAAIICSNFATAEGANRRSYDLLKERTHQLEASLRVLTGFTKKPNALPDYGLIALKEAEASQIALSEYLNDPEPGLRWVSGTGYINAWSMLHHAEEALIEAEPSELVIGVALHDKIAIQASTIANRDELLYKLQQAIHDLDPGALAYFNDQIPFRQYEELTQTLKQHHSILEQLVLHMKERLDPGEQSPVIKQQKPLLPGHEANARARAAVREVRRTLNCFRDNRWHGLIQARNQLKKATALTGLVTHALLCIAVINTVLPSTVSQAAVSYIVGAIAGMFGRFYREANNHTVIDDYDLATVRLVATPLLSGLAGIGGAFITTAFSNFLGLSGTAVAIFPSDMFEPRFMLASAVFGLTPNLIIQSLQQRAEQYAVDLQSSKGTECEMK